MEFIMQKSLRLFVSVSENSLATAIENGIPRWSETLRAYIRAQPAGYKQSAGC